MAGERSAYRKLQVVLGYAKDGQHQDQAALAEYILRRAPTNFAYYYRDHNTDEIVQKTSTRSIDASIALAVKLGLLSSGTTALSKTGMSATDPRRFPRIVASKTTAYLKKNGISLPAMRHAIREDLFHADPPELPTASAIWSRFQQAGIDSKEFARLLRILVDTGALKASQKRIYLP